MSANPTPPALPHWLACACLAASMALVGSYVALSKPLVATFPVFLLAWLRFGLGAVGMPHWLRRPASESAWTPRTRWLLFGQSFFGNFLFSICMLFGVSMTSAVSAGVIMAGIPAVVALLSWVLLRERVGLRMWAAVACAVAGVALISLQKEELLVGYPSHKNALSMWGNLLVFAAVLCEAIYVVIGKKLSGQLGARRVAAIINLWGLALVTPMGLWAAWGFDFRAVPGSLWLLLVFYAWAASVWTVWLWMTGMRGVPASQAGVFTVMLPISAVVVGVVWLGEPLTTLQMVALAIALAGVFLAVWPTRAAAASTAGPLLEKPKMHASDLPAEDSGKKKTTFLP